MTTDTSATQTKIRPELPRSRLLTASVRMKPDFIIIGAHKGGTTSLHSYLKRHPQIASPFRKEVHYFDLNFDKGLAWYRAHFPLLSKSVAGRLTGKRFITGESTPYYLFHPRAARRAFETVPHAKIIVLLRNPVDRAYSHFNHQLRNKNEPYDFAKALAREGERLAGEEEKILADESYYSFNHRKFSYRARGVYAPQLRRWMDLFARQQMLIMKSEDFYADPRSTVIKVLDFLGLEPIELKKYKKFLEGKYPEQDAQTRADLAKYFAPHNRQLFELIGEDYGWDG